MVSTAELSKAYGTELMILGKEEEYADAALGVVYVGGNYKVVYDVEKIIEVLEKQGMHHGEALQWYEHNISGAYLGDRTPLYLEKEY